MREERPVIGGVRRRFRKTFFLHASRIWPAMLAGARRRPVVKRDAGHAPAPLQVSFAEALSY